MSVWRRGWHNWFGLKCRLRWCPFLPPEPASLGHWPLKATCIHCDRVVHLSWLP